MKATATHKTIKMSNLLLIAGNGRNVGKTYLACSIITKFSKLEEVTGLKISPHFHSYNAEDVLFRNENYIVLNEKNITSKDSSFMLQAGAKKVYFVMVNPNYLSEALEKIQHLLANNLVVCESAGLHEFISPGLFFFVKRADEAIVKQQFLKYNPIIIENKGNNFDFDIQNIEFKNNKFTLKN